MKKYFLFYVILFFVSCSETTTDNSGKDETPTEEVYNRYEVPLSITDSSCSNQSEPKNYWLDAPNLSLSTKIFISDKGNETPFPNFWSDGTSCASSDGVGNLTIKK